MTRRASGAALHLFTGYCCMAIASSLLAGCSAVMDSQRIDPIITGADVEPGVVCKSDLGSYALPKAFIHVVVQRTDASSPPDIVSFNNTSPTGSILSFSGNNALSLTSPVEILRHPDRSLVFCLDYLASPLSHDIITVKKWPATAAATQAQKTSFLGAVIVNAQDRTVYVIEALLRAAFIFASGNTGFAPRDLPVGSTFETLADLEYDPFDPRESAEVNTRLSALGICLVLEGYTFDRSRTSVDGYCNSPKGQAAWTMPILKAYAKAKATPANPQLPGLLYRPRVPYRLFVFRKPDRGGGDHWKLGETQQVALENLSPVLSLDIRRAAFAGRNANFIFNSGTLVTACVAKKSEIEGFVDIPLQISRSLVALPASIASVQINQVNNQQALVTAESQLMQVQKAYLAALNGNKFVPVNGIQQGNLPTPTNFALPPDLTPTADTLANSISQAPMYGSDLFTSQTNQLDNICKGQT